MSSNTDILALVSTEADLAVDQIIEDSRRLHLIVNGTATEQAVTEDGSLIPSVRKAIIDNFYFKTPPLPWRNGSSVIEFNQLYAFTDVNGNVTWWYAPGATSSTPVVMRDSPINDGKFRPFFDKGNIQETYAPILSPVFRGNPTVPLAAEGDSSFTIANTAWVSREIEKVRGEVLEESRGEFQNIIVADDASLKDLYVSGETIFTGDRIAALDAELSLKRLRMTGTGAEIAFEQNGVPPQAGLTKRTNIKPFQVTTGVVDTDNITAREIKVGNTSVSTNSLDVDGFMQGDYLHLQGNANNAEDRPQLIVDGVAEINTLRVTNTIEGLKADVEGLDINPNSIVVERTAEIKGNTTLGADLSVSGNTVLKDVRIDGTLTGAGIGVDGKDISPRNVSATSVTVAENLNITGPTNASGDVTVNNLTVNGTLRADIDFGTSAVEFQDLTVTNRATIKDLEITGNVTGFTPSVDGEAISPSSVTTTGNIDVGNNLRVRGDLSLDGELSLPSLDTGDISAAEIDAASLSVSGDITAGTTSTTTVNNLVVTGTTTGITVTGNVDGQDILPSSVETTSVEASESVTTANLTATGETQVNNLTITGTVTGFEVDLTGRDIQVNTLTVTRGSTFDEVTANNITNNQKITTVDLQVTGNLTNANGEQFFANVTGQDILPNSVQSATSVRTKTLRVEETSLLEGAVTLNDGLTITAGNITSVQGQASFNDVQVFGSLLDANGNALGTAESINGKDISPRSVTAQVEIQTTAIVATGQAEVGSLISTGQVTAGSLEVSGIGNIDQVITDDIRAGKVTSGNTVITRTVGSNDPALEVRGPGEIQGDLNVTGTVTGNIDLSSQDVNVASMTSTGTINALSIESRTSVIGLSGTFGEDYEGAPTYGITSLSGANINKNLRVGGNLTVVGNISGNIDLSGKAIEPASLSTTTATLTTANITDLTVTGQFNIPTVPLNVQSLSSENAISASKFSTTPKEVSTTSSSYIPDGSTSIYNVNVINDVEVKAPIGLLSSGKGESVFLFFEQDGTGGHAVTFGSEFVVHGTETINTDANTVSVVNMVYRGKGPLIDVFITRR
ncbi:tail fiber protein [Escherichia phage A73]|uniref:Tail fiber protein n=1 Tax=Escherichia phage A73 TaxID=3003819 RepID=A0AAE9VX97_9CAUD|nr:tail fiber protein [Escherichia phage A73]WBF77833.1 tail fiber protein [Escherichia phage W70]